MKYKHIAGYNYENNKYKIILQPEIKKNTLLERFCKEGGKYVECYSKSANNGVAGANEEISTFVFAISSSKEATNGRTGSRPSKIISISRASSNVASTGVVGAKSEMVRIETVDSEISSNVANAGVTGAKTMEVNEIDSLFISFESESVDANIVFTEKRNIPVKIRAGWC